MVIALCTHNGARFLDEQLASYEAQTYTSWDLWVSDDNSNDATRDILDRWAARWQGTHQVHIINGPERGAAANFMALLCHPTLPIDRLVAMSDQDDIWHDHKLARAQNQIRRISTPLLYGAQSQYIDESGHIVGRSKPPLYAPSFANALTQNIVSGHSAVLNPEALEIVRKSGIPDTIAFHDWWLYQLISGAGGTVLIEREQVVSYRQHNCNVMGSHQGMRARIRRLKQVFDGTYRVWIEANLAALETTNIMLPDFQVHLSRIRRAHRGPARMLAFALAGLHRQNIPDTVVFYLATLLGRI